MRFLWKIVGRRKPGENVPRGGRALFEPLEPRLLLNADGTGMQPLPGEIPSTDPGIHVMLDPWDDLTQADLTPLGVVPDTGDEPPAAAGAQADSQFKDGSEAGDGSAIVIAADSQLSNLSKLDATAVGPSDYEQYLLELVNRGRANPTAEAARYGIDLNEGLAPGTISSDPKQPLALNLNLIDAARGHSQWMLDNDVFSHTGAGGSSPGDRMTAAGYDFLAP